MTNFTYQEREKLAEWLEYMFEGFSIPDETSINDMVWFEFDEFERWLNDVED